MIILNCLSVFFLSFNYLTFVFCIGVLAFFFTALLRGL